MTTCFGKELLAVRVFRECLPSSVCASFPFGFDGGAWDLIVKLPGHCLPFYIT